MHPRALLRMSLVATVAFFACFIVSGCGKQQKAAPAKMPQVSKQSAAADTADIFKEFYSEDSSKNKAGGKIKKGAKQETFSPSSSSSSFQPEFSPKGRYTVQITCVRSKSFADNMTGKMKDKGYPAYVAEVQNPTPNLSGTFYRVRIGGFDGLSAAKSFGENTLVPSGYQYWVDKKSNDNVGMEGYGLGSGSAGSNAATSYDNAPAAAGSTPAPAATPSSSYESPNSTYSSPSSSSSGSSGAAASGSPSSTYQAPATTTGSAAPASSGSAPAPASPASSTASPAPASSSAPAGTQSGSSTGATGATTGKASTGGSSESGWGTDSTSKSGW